MMRNKGGGIGVGGMAISALAFAVELAVDRVRALVTGPEMGKKPRESPQTACHAL